MRLPIEPTPKKKDERRDVFPKCDICYSVEDEIYQCKICGQNFCTDCGNPSTLVCMECEEEDKEKKPKSKK